MEKVVVEGEESQPTESILDPAKTKIADTAKLVADKPVMQKFTKKTSGNNNLMLVAMALVVIVAGIGTGWFLSGTSKASTTSKTPRTNIESATSDVTEMGKSSEENEEAEGELLEAEENAEGTHLLSRKDLGDNKDVALVSTAIDLQSFVGKRVKVWGETKAGRTAGWLMDVVKIKVVE